MQKLEEVKARRKTIGVINVIEQPKAAHCFPFFVEKKEKLALPRFQLRPSIFHINRTILLPTCEFHQSSPQRFRYYDSTPASFTLRAVTRNCKKGCCHANTNKIIRKDEKSKYAIFSPYIRVT